VPPVETTPIETAIQVITFLLIQNYDNLLFTILNELKLFISLGTVTNENQVQEEIKMRLNSDNATI
jgi:hypothetical protein